MNWDIVGYACWGVNGLLLVCAIGFAMRRELRLRRVRAEWMLRTPMSEEAFLSACGIPANGMENRIGRWMREELAGLARLSADRLRPDDRFDEPFFFDLSLLDFEHDVEKIFHIKPDREAEKGCLQGAGIWEARKPCELRHMIKAVAAGAANGKSSEGQL